MTAPLWLEVRRGQAPLIVSIPHAGTEIPPHLEGRFASRWLATRDADWWVDRLYAFADRLDTTTIATRLSRSVIDVNRDPSGVSLYPGMATTELCPTQTFDGEPLYRRGHEPNASEIADRQTHFFTPYHDALAAEIARLRGLHGAVAVYDAHSIRSRIPRLFEGELTNFNIGTNSGASCSPSPSPRRWRRPAANKAVHRSPTAASRADTSRVAMATRAPGPTPSRWNSPAVATWPSRADRRRRTAGRRPSIPDSPRR